MKLYDVRMYVNDIPLVGIHTYNNGASSAVVVVFLLSAFFY